MSDIFGPAGDLKVAVGIQLRGGLVVDDLVGAQNVVAIMNHDLAVPGPRIADAGLAARLPTAPARRWAVRAPAVPQVESPGRDRPEADAVWLFSGTGIARARNLVAGREVTHWSTSVR